MRYKMQENNNTSLTRRKLFSTVGKGIAAISLLTIPGLTTMIGKSKKINVKIHPDAIQRDSGRKK